jgi:hypothetical protein
VVGVPRPLKRRRCGTNSICHSAPRVCAATKGRGFLVSCSKVRPLGCRAKMISPAISGASCLLRQSACPCRKVQPGSDKLTGGSGAVVRQEATHVSASATPIARHQLFVRTAVLIPDARGNKLQARPEGNEENAGDRIASEFQWHRRPRDAEPDRRRRLQRFRGTAEPSFSSIETSRRCRARRCGPTRCTRAGAPAVPPFLPRRGGRS